MPWVWTQPMRGSVTLTTPLIGWTHTLGLDSANERKCYILTTPLIGWAHTLGMGSANERRHYIVTPPLIGWAHTQNGPCWHHDTTMSLWKCLFVPLSKILFPTFYRRHFQINFVCMEIVIFLLKFHWNLFPRFQLTIRKHELGSDNNGLALNRWEAINWTNDAFIYICAYSSLDIDELTHWILNKMADVF